MLSGCGYQSSRSTDYRWHGMRRGTKPLAIWQYTVSGSGMLDYNGTLTEVTAGQAMLLHIPHNHCYYLPDSSDHWEFIYLNFNGRELLRLWHELEQRIGPVVTLHEQSTVVQTAIKIVTASAAGQLQSPFDVSALAYKVVMDLAETVPKQGQMDNISPAVHRVIDYCTKHFSEIITVDDMARVSGYSRYHFSHLFKESQGISPAAFLRNLRLQQSLRLLQSELITVKEVAERCGFSNVNYFCKVVRQHFGTTPNGYRHGGYQLTAAAGGVSRKT